MNYDTIDREADRAAKRLCRRLMYPGSSDLPMFSVPARSADFGKGIDVSFFSDPTRPFYRIKSKLRACKNSLWPTGQMAIEFGVFRLFMQIAYHRLRPVYEAFKRKGFV